MVVMNRREWAGSILAGTLMATPRKQRICAVIGAGVLGAWMAYHLLSAGDKVILLDE